MKKYTKEQQKEVTEALKTEKKVEQYKRLQAINMRMQGIEIKEICKQLQFSEHKVWRVCVAYLENGLAGLLSKNKGGNNRKLSREIESVTLEKLAHKAESGDFIRVSELKEAFENETGVKYHLNTFYCILSRNNWRKSVPRGKHPQGADEAAILAAKKLTSA
jgi:transposase